MTETQRGTCFCGSVEIEAAGVPMEMGYCHCNSCRAYSGGPVKSYMLWKAEEVTVTRGGDLLGRFSKTGMSDRQFCMRCGGHLMTRHPQWGLTDVYASVLPGIHFEPSVHLNYAETVLPIRDGLPKLREFPAEAGGTGETMAE